MAEPVVTERVAANVRAEMARQRKTQSALATALGRSQMFLSRRLGGQTPFDLDELDRIAAILDIPIERLLAERVA